MTVPISCCAWLLPVGCGCHRMLEIRGIQLDDEQQRQATECVDNDQLDTWFRTAAIASRAEHIFP